ncbi:MAG: CocE/NonD family hydrolase [Actinocatenispora sp.]
MVTSLLVGAARNRCQQVRPLPPGSPDIQMSVVEWRSIWIPLNDGCRLSARIWLPLEAGERPVPAIVEYIPYRKNDGTATRDVSMHPHFAAAGYAAVRVDLRGSGDSDGVMLDEYAPTELSDALEVFRWLAAQPWCTGRVGMVGKSWGGFNGLQVAALTPPELGAVVTVCSTDDRYADDVHYTGGALLASEMLPWASTMLAWNARPPDPDVVGDEWLDRWLERLDGTPPYVTAWLTHQRRDAYWRHGSVCETPTAISVPVLAVGGLEDPYRGAVFRMLEQLSAPVRALLGPWSHNYPHQGEPGPRTDFVGEALRWFDQHLKGLDTRATDLPALRVFVPESASAGASGHPGPDRPGRWTALERWPDPRVQVDERSLRDAERPLPEPAVLRSDEPVGTAAGSWLRFGDPAGVAADQRADDARSFTATFPACRQPVDVLGVPTVRLRVSADAPVAQLAVRLCDVGPDGRSELVTAGLVNLTHRNGHDEPAALEPGVRYPVDAPMVATAHRFRPGHRVRVSVSAAYWPWAWPSPRTVSVTLHDVDSAVLCLPVLTGDDVDVAVDPPRADPPHELRRSPARHERRVDHDEVTGRLTVTLRTGSGEFVDGADGLRADSTSEDRFSWLPSDPASAVVECDRTETVGRGGWRTLVRTASRMTADGSTFFVSNRVEAFHGDTRVFHRTWRSWVPRDHT